MRKILVTRNVKHAAQLKLKIQHQGLLIEIKPADIKNTRDQSSNDQWFDERKKRLTASNFGAVIKRKKSIHPISLLEKIHNQHRQSNPPAPCKWGLDKEENAIKAYCSFKKQEEKTVSVCSRCGFVVNPTSPWLHGC